MAIIGAGITKLSQLQIDAIKDWAGKRIDNLGAPNTDDDAPRARAGDILSGRLLLARLPDGTSGQVLTAQGAGVDPAYAAAAADYPMKQKPAMARWVVPGWQVAQYKEVIPVAGYIYYCPIFVEETTTYIRIGCYVGTAGSADSQADLRIFAWNNGLPGSLILSAGTVATNTVAAKEITISQQLIRGYHFLAIRLTGTSLPAMWGIDTTYGFQAPVSGQRGGNAGGQVPFSIMFANAAYADPAPAPTGIMEAEEVMVALREN
jgi:hypothetical protein